MTFAGFRTMGPRCGCNACTVFFDAFDRAAKPGSNYQFRRNATGNPDWTADDTDWNCAGGQLVTTVSDSLIRCVGPPSGSLSGGVVSSLDLTFTGTGSAIVGSYDFAGNVFGVKLNFDGQYVEAAGKRNLAYQTTPRCDYPLVSGVTYHLEIVQQGGGDSFEVKLNGAAVIASSVFPIGGVLSSSPSTGLSGGLGFIGSGTLSIDNLQLEAIRHDVNCPDRYRCFFPWGRPGITLPPRLQLDIYGPIRTTPDPGAPANFAQDGGQCVNCQTLPGSYILNRIDPDVAGPGGAIICQNISGVLLGGGGFSSNPCACYFLDGSFACFYRIVVRSVVFGDSFHPSAESVGLSFWRHTQPGDPGFPADEETMILSSLRNYDPTLADGVGAASGTFNYCGDTISLRRTPFSAGPNPGNGNYGGSTAKPSYQCIPDHMRLTGLFD